MTVRKNELIRVIEIVPSVADVEGYDEDDMPRINIQITNGIVEDLCFYKGTRLVFMLSDERNRKQDVMDQTKDLRNLLDEAFQYMETYQQEEKA